MSTTLRLIAGLIISLSLLTSCTKKEISGGIQNAWTNSSKALQNQIDRFHKPPPDETLIETRPRGAVVEINGEYVGKTPLKVKWDDLKSRFPKLADAETVIIKAYPTQSGLYTHTRIYNKKIDQQSKVFPPRKLYFNLSLLPMAKSEEE